MTKGERRALARAENIVVDTLAALAGGDRNLAQLLDLSVGRVLRKLMTGGVVPNYDQRAWTQTHFDLPRLEHVRDWLAASLVTGARWLENVDDLGRPKKIMKCGSIDALHAEADKYMLREAAKLGKAAALEGHETVVFQAPDDWNVVRMLTAEALDRESAFMRHCIGNGGYDQMLGDKDCGLYSLRDPFGKPHVTVEVSDRRVLQIQGKQNRPPIREYLERLAPFLQAEKLAVSSTEFGIIFDSRGQVHLYDDLPDELEVHGDFVLQSSSRKQRRLPRVIRATGSIRINGDNFSSYPEILEAGGDIAIVEAGVTSAPAVIVLGGTLRMYRSAFEALPDGLAVPGNLLMSEMKNLVSLPLRLRVGGFLDISRTHVSSIPDCARFGGIDITSTPVEVFDTACFLPLEETSGMHRELVASRSSLKTIKGHPWFEVLDLYMTRMTELPVGLKIDTKLEISRTPIRTVPEGCVPRDVFMADGCDIESLPEKMDCTLVSFWRSNVSFPKTFTCGETLKLLGATILRMPETMAAKRILLRQAEFGTLPGTIVAEIVDVGETSVRAIPDGYPPHIKWRGIPVPYQKARRKPNPRQSDYKATRLPSRAAVTPFSNDEMMSLLQQLDGDRPPGPEQRSRGIEAGDRGKQDVSRASE